MDGFFFIGAAYSSVSRVLECVELCREAVRRTAMILQPVEYNVANLLHSSDAVAAVQLDGEELKDMILAVREQDWGAVVVEAASGEHWLMFAARSVQQGNFVGDVRKWSRELGCQFFLKLSNEEWSTPSPNVFVLPDGREVEIQNVLARAGNNTHWLLHEDEVLPDGYVRL
jgi:hypothetical protein